MADEENNITDNSVQAAPIVLPAYFPEGPAKLMTAEEAKKSVKIRKLIKEESYVASVISEAIDNEKFECQLNKLSKEIIEKLEEKGYYIQKVTDSGSDYGYTITWNHVTQGYTEAETIEDIIELITGEADKVYIEVNEDLEVAAEAVIQIPEGKKIFMKLENTTTVAGTSFVVGDNSELTLKGEGTINVTTKSADAPIIVADGAKANVVIDGVTIDCVTEQGEEDNFANAIALKNGASLIVKSGTIKTAKGACILADDIEGNYTSINILGGELLSTAGYAMYSAAQGVCNIKGGTVQGLEARIGHFNISGNAEIIAPAITDENAEDIGAKFDEEGIIALGDAIAIIAGTVNDTEGNDCVINVKGDATVAANIRAAIGVYCVDTWTEVISGENEEPIEEPDENEDLLKHQTVKLIIANKDNITTEDAESEAIKTYDHDYIGEAAEAAEKTYAPMNQTDIVVVE